MPGWLRTLLFRTHWVLGISAGLVLAVVGATGALLAFEHEILDVLNPQFRLEPAGERLPPDALVARVRTAYPDLDLRGLAIPLDQARPAEARMAKPGERAGVVVAIDPWRGDVLGVPRGAGFVRGAEQLHRSLLAGDAGKQLVGASTLALLVMIVTGLVLRWPRGRAGSPSAWLKVDRRARGRGFLWSLHSVLATWVLALYLVSALTGLWWSYAFYRNAVSALAGVPAPPERRGPGGPGGAGAGVAAVPRVAPPAFDAGWQILRREAPNAVRAMVAVPATPGAPIEWRYLDAGAAHERAFSTLRIDPADAGLLAHEQWSELPSGRRFIAAIFPLHSGSYFGNAGRVLMAAASLLMPLFAVTGLWMWVLRRSLRRNAGLRGRLPGAIAAPIRARTAAEDAA